MERLIKDKRVCVIDPATGRLSTDGAAIAAAESLSPASPQMWVDGIPFAKLHTVVQCNLPQGNQCSYTVATSATRLIADAELKAAAAAAVKAESETDDTYRRLMAERRLTVTDWLNGGKTSDPKIVYLYSCVNETTLDNVFLDQRPIRSLMTAEDLQAKLKPQATQMSINALPRLVVDLAQDPAVTLRSAALK
jgi:hypothetical protein